MKSPQVPHSCPFPILIIPSSYFSRVFCSFSVFPCPLWPWHWLFCWVSQKWSVSDTVSLLGCDYTLWARLPQKWSCVLSVPYHRFVISFYTVKIFHNFKDEKSVAILVLVLQRNRTNSRHMNVYVYQHIHTHTHTYEWQKRLTIRTWLMQVREVEKSQGVPSASWRPRRDNRAVQVQVQRPEGQENWWCMFQSESRGRRKPMS